jgi:two-component system, OmpR family, phosphate regulon sensor histidine kinase PhoR
VSGLSAALPVLLLGVALGLALAWLLPRSSGATQLWRGVSVRRLLGWIDASSSGWMILDRDDRVLHLNPRAQRLLQVDGSRLWQGVVLAQLNPDRVLREAVQLARRQDRSQRLGWESPEGELELLVLPADGGWLALLLTSRRSLEAQLAQQERWVSDVAHELKTPLTALLLVGDSLAARVTPANAVLVQRLQRELLRLQQLVGDLLELSRLENSVPDAPSSQLWFEAPALVEQVWQGLRPIAEQRQISLSIQVHGGSGRRAPIAIQADGARVHRALLNLLDNALRYSPEGGCITVLIQPRGRWCLLAVRDQGPGLSSEDQEHLFERFYRGDPARAKGARTGSGLGLAIVQQIAVSQGGRVQAGNHAGGGAQIELILPMLPRVPAATSGLPG